MLYHYISLYKYTIFHPISNSDHNLVALRFNTFSPAAVPWHKRTFWQFRHNWADWKTLSRFFQTLVGVNHALALHTPWSLLKRWGPW